MATITKRDLVLKITNDLGAKGTLINQKDVQEVVQCFIDEIT